jgi:hypothetical protein
MVTVAEMVTVGPVAVTTYGRKAETIAGFVEDSAKVAGPAPPVLVILLVPLAVPL